MFTLDTRSRVLGALVGLGLGTFAAGCGVAEDPSSAQGIEEVGHTTEALCTDPGIANYQGLLGSTAGSSVCSTSGSSYGSAACLNYYVVEAAQTFGKNVSISADWVDTSVRDSQALCEAARLQGVAYGYDATGWHTLGAKTLAGTWDSFFGCSFIWSPSVEVAHPNPSSYSRIRIAARAYINTIFGPAYHPVQGCISIPSDPPPPPR
ncbi:MAG TPA: hypothetical protein VH877_18710 [Polyangia bacterium]|nr:hypothetical protein [Polyangia bacterium]